MHERPATTDIDTRVRRAIFAVFADGGNPKRSDIARRCGLSERDVAASFERLAAMRVLVLDPHKHEIWMAMPFSAVPTAFRVQSGDAAWWANCAWDALGIAAATERDVRVESTCADCNAPITLEVHQDGLERSTAVAHFAVPAAEWWTDIGFT